MRDQAVDLGRKKGGTECQILPTFCTANTKKNHPKMSLLQILFLMNSGWISRRFRDASFGMSSAFILFFCARPRMQVAFKGVQRTQEPFEETPRSIIGGKTDVYRATRVKIFPESESGGSGFFWGTRKGGSDWQGYALIALHSAIQKHRVPLEIGNFIGLKIF